MKSDQKGLGLGIEGHIPLIEGDVHRRLVERRQLGPRVAHEDVQRAELALDPAEHATDLIGAGDVRLDDEPV